MNSAGGGEAGTGRWSATTRLGLAVLLAVVLGAGVYLAPYHFRSGLAKAIGLAGAVPGLSTRQVLAGAFALVGLLIGLLVGTLLARRSALTDEYDDAFDGFGDDDNPLDRLLREPEPEPEPEEANEVEPELLTQRPDEARDDAPDHEPGPRVFRARDQIGEEGIGHTSVAVPPAEAVVHAQGDDTNAAVARAEEFAALSLPQLAERLGRAIDTRLGRAARNVQPSSAEAPNVAILRPEADTLRSSPAVVVDQQAVLQQALERLSHVNNPK